jgi:hypothetical protein
LEPLVTMGRERFLRLRRLVDDADGGGIGAGAGESEEVHVDVEFENDDKEEGEDGGICKDSCRFGFNLPNVGGRMRLGDAEVLSSSE